MPLPRKSRLRHILDLTYLHHLTPEQAECILGSGGRVLDRVYMPLEPECMEEEVFEGGDQTGWEYEWEEEDNDDDVTGRGNTARGVMH